MPHWRQEAKENARQVRHMKELLAAAEDILGAIDNGLRPKAADRVTIRLRLSIAKAKGEQDKAENLELASAARKWLSNSTEPVE